MSQLQQRLAFLAYRLLGFQVALGHLLHRGKGSSPSGLAGQQKGIDSGTARTAEAVRSSQDTRLLVNSHNNHTKCHRKDPDSLRIDKIKQDGRELAQCPSPNTTVSRELTPSHRIRRILRL